MIYNYMCTLHWLRIVFPVKSIVQFIISENFIINSLSLESENPLKLLVKLIKNPKRFIFAHLVAEFYF